ncbi:hypothetical protein [Nonomuraea sp. B19D2]|uniref:hypothetical protein n=1 Tax=Nonomuraea sp. B19D2 TaxID=3159561 RepID=UPI0032DAB129
MTEHYRPLTLSRNLATIEGAVVLNADTSSVDTVLVAGRAVKRGGQLLHHDLTAVLATLAESAGVVMSA